MRFSKRSLIPVTFVYRGPDGREAAGQHFRALCFSVPRVGESIAPRGGGPSVVVTEVYHKAARPRAGSRRRVVLIPTVVVAEQGARQAGA
jgi:hypothetical protein